MKRTPLAITTALCLILAAAGVTLAQAPAGPAAGAPPSTSPLADRLPGGTLLYLAWAGRNKPLDDSLVGKLLQEPGFAKMADAIRVALVAKASGDGHELVEGGWELASTALRHPLAIAVIDIAPAHPPAAASGPADMPRFAGPPEVSAALLIDLGADRKEFATKLDALIEKMGMKLEDGAAGDIKIRQLATPAGPVSLGYLGDTLFLCLGKDVPGQLAAVSAAKSLSADKSFAGAMKAAAGPNIQLAFYLDAAGLMKKIQPLIEPDGARAAGGGPGLSKVMRSLGLGDLKSLAGSLCMTDGLCHSKLRIVTPAPHKGVLLPLAGEPLTDADLAALPGDVDLLAAAKFSADGLYDEVRRIIKELNPEADADLTRELADPKSIVSKLALKDLLGCLGQTWTISMAQSYGGMFTGTLLTVEVKDEAKLAAAVARLEDMAKQAIPPDAGSDDMFGGRPRGPAPAIRVTKAGDVEIHYFSFGGGMPMPVAPAWAIYKGRLYVAGWPQIIQAAIDNQGKSPLVKAAGGRVTVADLVIGNGDFSDLRARLGGSPSIITYVNSPHLLRQGYAAPLMLWTTAAGMIPAKDQPAMPDWLPPLSTIEKYVRPEISSVSADKDGITIEGYGTIPGISAAPAVPAVAVAVLMPALSHAKGQARSASSKANLSAIGKAIAVYVGPQGDKWPPDFAALVPYLKSPAIFVSPLSNKAPPKYDEKKKTLTGEVDYIYIPLNDAAPANLICAYERPENSVNGQVNVLYADLHVGELDMQSLQAELKKTQEYVAKRASK